MKVHNFTQTKFEQIFSEEHFPIFLRFKLAYEERHLREKWVGSNSDCAVRDK